MQTATQTLSIEALLKLGLVSGFVLVIVGLLGLTFGSWLNPSWAVQGFSFMLPFVISGIIIMAVFGKLMEVLT